MILFASDLDNTLIHSYKRAAEDDICVEVKEGKKLSYMTPEAYKMLGKLFMRDDIVFVPVTTRSLEQYRRIDFFEGIPAEIAVAANGGILIENGIVNREWYEESKKMIKECIPVFEKGISFLEKDSEVYFEIRVVDELFVFTKSHSPEKTRDNLAAVLDSELINVYNIGGKVYIFPRIMSKGFALKRLCRKYSFEKIVCAGDSEFDIPMLEEADTAYCPDALVPFISSENVKGFDISQKRLADHILKEIEG